MKKLILCIAVLVCAMSVAAQDQGYLTGTNTIELVEGESLIVLCAVNGETSGDVVKVELPPYGGSTIYSPAIGPSSDLAQRTIIGPCKVRPFYDSRIFMYKINRAPVFTNPMNVVTLPADNNGDVDLLVETSPDLQTWTPVYSGSVGTSNDSSFIRTRLIQN